MRRGLAIAVLVGIGVGLASAGCGDSGDNSTDAGGPQVTYSVSRDFGLVSLTPRTAEPLEAHRTVMRLLRAGHDVGTAFSGRVVESIDGLHQRRGAAVAKHPSGTELAWIFYVNGFDADVLPYKYRLYPGDVVHWDLREWDTGLSVRATVGAFPETFTRGMFGRRFPVTVECDSHSAAACERVRATLREVGVSPDGRRPPGPRPQGREPRDGRVLVGRWTSFRERPWPRIIDTRPDDSGVFARFTPNARTIQLLDWNTRPVRSVGAGSGLVAAMRPTETDVMWLVTGVDDEGVARAARALNPRSLRDAIAVVATRDGLMRVPVRPRR